MPKYYVIAGGFFEFKDWKSRNYPEMLLNGQIQGVQDIIYVSGAESFKGVTNPNGIFIGTWYNRIDIDKILNQLTVAMNDTNKLEPIQKAWAYLESKTWMEVT